LFSGVFAGDDAKSRTSQGTVDMARPKLLDLFCGAGGCAVGYHGAGFDVIGVDIKKQKNYPFPMVIGDALRPPFDLRMFDVVHASPPCQTYSALKNFAHKHHESLIEPVRDLLQKARIYVIENVPGAPLRRPAVICGSWFCLKVRRHRLFESNVRIHGNYCTHKKQGRTICVAGSGGSRVNRRKDDHGGACNYGTLPQCREAMGIDWMSRAEIVQAIPPAYTEYIGKQLIRAMAQGA
jgi:DNA (cytosine-5)-methyltransferase 1